MRSPICERCVCGGGSPRERKRGREMKRCTCCRKKEEQTRYGADVSLSGTQRKRKLTQRVKEAGLGQETLERQGVETIGVGLEEGGRKV